MNRIATELETVVVCAAHAEGEDALRRALAERGASGARRMDPRDFDDVDRAVREGGVGRVIVSHADDLMRAVWDERIDLTAWNTAGVEIDVLDEGTAKEGVSGRFTHVAASWAAWNRQRRRRAIIAGLIFSLIATGAAFWLLAQR